MENEQTPLANAIRGCVPALAATFIISLFINTAMLTSPLYSMQVYDRVLTSRNINTLLLLTAIVTLFLILYGILEFVRSGILVRAGARFEALLRRPLFETMMQAEATPYRQGQQPIRDAEAIREGLSNGTIATLCDLPWTPVFVVLCFILHPLLGTVALLGAVILFSLAVLAEYATRHSIEKTSKLASAASGFANSILRNSEAVRGLGMGDTVLNRWSGMQSAAVAGHAQAHRAGRRLARHVQVRADRRANRIALRRRVAGHREADLTRRHVCCDDHHGTRTGSHRADGRAVEAHCRHAQCLSPPDSSCFRLSPRRPHRRRCRHHLAAWRSTRSSSSLREASGRRSTP